MRNLKRGSRGDDVKGLQTALNDEFGYGLAVDGIFGNKTDSAVRDCQKRKGWKVDGIAGRETQGGLGILDISDYIIPCENLKQFTPPLDKTIYGKDKTWSTYKSGGCGILSFTIVYRALGLAPEGETWLDTVLRLGDYAVKMGYRVKDNGTKYTVFGTNGCKYEALSRSATAIENAIRSGCLVILHLDKGYGNGYGGNGHYVCAYGIQGNYLLLRDVGSSLSSRQKVLLSKCGSKLKGAYKMMKR